MLRWISMRHHRLANWTFIVLPRRVSNGYDVDGRAAERVARKFQEQGHVVEFSIHDYMNGRSELPAYRLTCYCAPGGRKVDLRYADDVYRDLQAAYSPEQLRKIRNYGRPQQNPVTHRPSYDDIVSGLAGGNFREISARDLGWE